MHSLTAAHAALLPLYQPAALPPSDLPTVETRGVSLAALRWLKDEAVARFGDDVNTMDTSTVCDRLIKPLLSSTPDWTLVDIFDQQPNEELRCKPANRFVSHAWRYMFMDVMTALIELAEQPSLEGEDVYFWFDLCCNNQHRASSLPYEWWTTTFASSVGAIGHTVLLYGPWSDPVPLKRSWCLYELWSKTAGWMCS